jgi:23S rRNA pseudouridine1911/1915/1917 synthase
MNPSKKIELIVSKSDAGSRLDKYLQQNLPQYSRSFFQKLINNTMVEIDGNIEKSSYKVDYNQKITLNIPQPELTNITPENIQLGIIYEDKHLVVVNKPPGMIVHPGAGVQKGTLVNALLYHCKDLSGVAGRLRPGIVHRLDKNTSGLLIVAKNDISHYHLVQQISERAVSRIYTALVWHNVISDKGKIESNINRSKKDRKLFTVANKGKKAVTFYEVIKRYRIFSFLRIQLQTGRTHQIRIHLNHIHHPVFGDPEYHGRQKQLGQIGKNEDKRFAKKLLEIMPRQALHAHELKFIHPVTKKRMEFSCEEPEDIKFVLKKLDEHKK